MSTIELHYTGSPPQMTDTYPRKGTPDKEDEATVMLRWNFEKLRKQIVRKRRDL